MRFKDAHFMEALYVVLLGFCVVALSSCAHHEKLEQKVEAEVQAEPRVAPGPELAAKGQEIVLDANNLRPSQKAKLKKLYSKASQEMTDIRTEIGRHQMVLMKDLVDPKVGEDEIKLVKQKILSLERQRTELWLQHLDDAKRILGRRSEADEKLYRPFILSEPRVAEPGAKTQIE